MTSNLEQRSHRWADASHGLAELEQFLAVSAQQLGRLDCDLTGEWVKCLTLIDEGELGLQERDNLDRHLYLSYLWVLGAYELIRTADQRACKRWGKGAALRLKIEMLKNRFNRLRVPLAKMEPERGREATDYAIAFPHWRREDGIRWNIAEDEYVSRLALADELLVLLEELRAAKRES